MKVRRFFIIGIIAALTAMTFVYGTMAAGGIMPDFATLPAGWVTDRYEPASFANIGVYQGHWNVLEIGIDETTGLPARPTAYQSTFYNTQGRKYTFSPVEGPGSVLSADLYIPASWGDAANGNVRTDMWGTMVDSDSAISAYSIIGFTNYGGVPRLRVFDGDIGWVDLGTAITYDTWTNFAIKLLPNTSIEYYVNGVLVYTDSATGSSVAFKEVIMQAYNFEDPAITGAVIVPYTAHWSNSNSVVPVPSNKDQCKNGGWMTLFRADGTSFNNQGDCIQYVNTER